MGHEYDDNGLPPVDIDIPDDASDLEREVQAYRREVRWQRRVERLKALSGSRRYGTTGPLVLGVFLLAALCAALLVLSARPTGQDVQRSRDPKPNSMQPGEIGGPLPATQVTLAGSARPLRELRPAVLVLAPAGCGCVPALEHLVAQSGNHGVPVYFVESGKAAPDRTELARRLGDGSRRPQVVGDAAGTLAREYNVAGLTAILVNQEGKVSTVVHRATSSTGWKDQLAPLLGSWQP